MGRGGAEALPFMLKGRTEIQRLMQEAKDMGIAPSKEDEAKVAEYAKVMARAERATLGMKLAIGHAFLPVMERLGETIAGFVVEHGPEFRKWADELGGVIEKTMPTVEDLEGAFHSLGNAIQWAGEHTTLVKLALGAVVALPFLPFIASLFSLTAALITLAPVLGTVAAGLGSITLAIAPELVALAAITAAVYALGNAYTEVSSNWSTFSDLDAWKGMGKNILGIGPSSDPASTQQEVNAMRKTRGGAGASSSGGKNYNPVFHFNINAAPGMDAHSVADMVMNKLDGRMNAMASGALFD